MEEVLTNLLMIAFITALVIGAFVVGPLMLLWGLNLLGLSVPYTVGTWFGAFLVLATVQRGVL